MSSLSNSQILIVDDEPSISETLAYALECEGFTVSTCLLGKEAIEYVSANTDIAFVILDIGLPDINGFEVCKQIRASHDVPILFLTARSEEIDRVVGLEIGADDYVTKPFSPREVSARVKNILKRYHFPKTRELELLSKNLVIDQERAQVQFFQKEIVLTKYEFLLLKTLANTPERVFSRAQLMDEVWPSSLESMERVVDTHIKSLRAKMRAVNPNVEAIKTHRGLGYSLNRL